MKKQFTTKMKVLTAIGVLSTMSLTAIAAPILQEVSATLRKDITFTLNGEKTLEGTNVIMYENSAYLPLRALGDELGMKIDYVDGEIKITNEASGMSKTITTDEIPATELTPAVEIQTIGKAIIKEIEPKEKQLTILPDGKEDIYYNYIEFNLSDESIIKSSNGTLSTIEDLSIGMEITATHLPYASKSTVPQSNLLTMEILSSPLANITIDNLQIIEVNLADSYIIASTPDDLDNPINQKKFILHEDTNVKHYKNKMTYQQTALKVGQKINVEVGPIMNPTSGGIYQAIEIILMD